MNSSNGSSDNRSSEIVSLIQSGSGQVNAERMTAQASRVTQPTQNGSDNPRLEVIVSNDVMTGVALWLFISVWSLLWILLFSWIGRDRQTLSLLESMTIEARKMTQSSLSTLKGSRRIPCKRCQFYSENLYLKCAIRPMDVSTERALECTDFCPRKRPASPSRGRKI